MQRNGIISAGNWVIDHIKMIDTWPGKGNLANIKLVAGRALGGCAHNVLVNLARLQTDIPLWAGGIVGNDDNGRYIMDEIAKYNIDNRYMSIRDGVTTSFTDVMSEMHSGARTFFHYRGSNALLDYSDLEKMESSAKIFHLGYLLLLDKLDSFDEKYGTVGAKVLHMLKSKGYEISIDVVSEQGERFRSVVIPSLKYVDYLICNEIEAGACTDIALRKKDTLCRENLSKVAEDLFNQGVNKMVVIHFPEGGYVMQKDGQQLFVPAFKVSQAEIKSTVGAGDAFCAGALYAIHEGFSLHEMLLLANANARFNLLSENSTGGAVPLFELQKYIKTD
ncbi:MULTISPECIES: carbohydrate kinase family protein [Proteiniphilum]|jgi:sugar/nucleoside kinase (ribokinase family)|uniref:carbohydrate kinase family protein n=1 Tax=Proteiniphilum TaxID=294702 RepID=UPI001EEBB4F1|nr:MULTISPECIES: carbohydrate kinase family protein [Proteiniphilum]ULB34037.1 carbohydrate kinase family protein [Proteiniphilum propionicum]